MSTDGVNGLRRELDASKWGIRIRNNPKGVVNTNKYHISRIDMRSDTICVLSARVIESHRR